MDQATPGKACTKGYPQLAGSASQRLLFSRSSIAFEEYEVLRKAFHSSQRLGLPIMKQFCIWQNQSCRTGVSSGCRSGRDPNLTRRATLARSEREDCSV